MSLDFQLEVSLARRRDDDSDCVDYEQPHHYAQCVDDAVKVLVAANYIRILDQGSKGIKQWKIN